MFALVKTAIFSVGPGAAGVYCLTIQDSGVCIQEVLLEKEKTLGGCKLGLINSFDNKTGGFIEDTFDGKLGEGKLKRLSGNLRENALKQLAANIRSTCEKRTEKIVELSLGNSHGTIEPRTGVGNHIKVS